MVPVDSLPQMEDIGRVVQRLPPLGQIRLDDEGARLDPCTDLIPHELAVNEAQCPNRLEVGAEVVIEVDGVIAAHAEDAPALGWPRFCPPERLRAIQRPGRQRGAGSEAGFQHLATADPCGMSETYMLCRHRDSF